MQTEQNTRDRRNREVLLAVAQEADRFAAIAPPVWSSTFLTLKRPSEKSFIRAPHHSSGRRQDSAHAAIERELPLPVPVRLQGPGRPIAYPASARSPPPENVPGLYTASPCNNRPHRAHGDLEQPLPAYEGLTSESLLAGLANQILRPSVGVGQHDRRPESETLAQGCLRTVFQNELSGCASQQIITRAVATLPASEDASNTGVSSTGISVASNHAHRRSEWNAT